MKVSRIVVVSVLLLILGCSVLAVETNSERSESLTLLQAKTGFVIDDVLALLNGFQSSIKNDIENLDGVVRSESDFVSGIIDGLKKKTQNKKDLCNDIHDQSVSIEKEKQKVIDFIDWMENRIISNEQKIEDYNTKSCSQTMDFVEFVRNAQNTLNFVDYLRKAISEYSFVQMKAVTTVLESFNLHDEGMSSAEVLQGMLLQLTAAASGVDSSRFQSGETLDKERERTSDEIGIKHIDNDKGELNLEHSKRGRSIGLESAKNELFEILDKLQKSVSDSLNLKIQNQIALSEATADYIIFMERENESLHKELVVQKGVLSDIETRILQLQKDDEQCANDVIDFEKEIKETQEKHDKYISDKAAYRITLINQQDQLQAIITIYENNVATAAQSLKKRVDDLSDNQTVDYSAEVDDRQLTLDYGNLKTTDDIKGKLEQQVINSTVNSADEA